MFSCFGELPKRRIIYFSPLTEDVVEPDIKRIIKQKGVAKVGMQEPNSAP